MLSKLLLFLDQTGLLHSGYKTRHKGSLFSGLGKKMLRTRVALGLTASSVHLHHLHCLDLGRIGPRQIVRALRSISVLEEEESSGKGKRAGVEFSSNVHWVNHAKWIGVEGSHTNSGREYFPRAKTH